MNGQPTSVGIIGLGRSGWDIHGACLSRHPAFRIQAVADVRPEKLTAAQSAWGCAGHTDWRELLCDPAIELVVIATPSNTHCSVTLAALAAGKGVIVDKPMALSVADADAMIAAAQGRGRLLTVFQNWRYLAACGTVWEVLASGRLGPIELIRFGVYDYVRRDDWQSLRRQGGGMLNNLGAHLLDQALVLLDGHAGLGFCDFRQTIGGGDAEDQVIILLRGRTFPVQVEIISCCAAPQPGWVIIGHHGTLMIQDGRVQIRWCDPAKRPPLPAPDTIPPYSDGRYPCDVVDWQVEEFILPAVDANRAYYDALAASLTQGAPPPVLPEQSRQVLKLIEACRHSVATGSTVADDPVEKNGSGAEEFQ